MSLEKTKHIYSDRKHTVVAQMQEVGVDRKGAKENSRVMER